MVAQRRGSESPREHLGKLWGRFGGNLENLVFVDLGRLGGDLEDRGQGAQRVKAGQDGGTEKEGPLSPGQASGGTLKRLRK